MPFWLFGLVEERMSMQYVIGNDTIIQYLVASTLLDNDDSKIHVERGRERERAGSI